ISRSSGQVGPEGPTGKRGSRGRKGHSGDHGEKGTKGDRGDRGPPGLPGVRGYATKDPRKVAFSVARSLKLGPLIKDSVVLFDNVITNVGNSFDEHTSHFVCRVNGTYLFATHVLSQNNKDVYAWIMLNNKHKLPLHGDGRAGYATGSQTVILRLIKGDRVWLQLRKDSALLNDFSTFSGYLLFED
ncbi:Caprin-2, partial [Lamellibrachia satsuma]